MEFVDSVTMRKVASHTKGKRSISNKLVKIRNADFSLANVIADDTYLSSKEFYPRQDPRRPLLEDTGEIIILSL